jgi:hypothetical protein
MHVGETRTHRILTPVKETDNIISTTYAPCLIYLMFVILIILNIFRVVKALCYKPEGRGFDIR